MFDIFGHVRISMHWHMAAGCILRPDESQTMATSKQPLPEVVSADQWKTALDQLLVKEKELTRARDALNAERRRLPMVKVAKHYTLQGENGAVVMLKYRRYLL